MVTAFYEIYPNAPEFDTWLRKPVSIPKDSVEYELAWASGSAVIDRSCFVVWQNALNRLERRLLR